MNYDLFKQRWFVLISIVCLTFATVFIGTKVFVMYEEYDVDSKSSSNDVTVSEIMVHVKGAVSAPGVYKLSRNSRIADLVEAAGGFVENANPEGLNLASYLIDGSDYYVPFLKDENDQDDHSDLINMSTASERMLTTLSGIGPATAAKIIAYREKNGPFTRFEQLLEAGVSQKLLDQIQDQITLN